MINVSSNSGGILQGLNGLVRPHPGGSGFSKTNQPVPQARGHADHDSGFTHFTPPKAGTLLNDKMASSAGNALKANAPQSLADQGADDFSPEKIAQNILSFIDSAIASARASGDDPAAIEKRLADAQAGVEKGFAEAKDILQSFGAWNGAIKENAEKTLDLIHKGLDDRSATTAPQAPPAQNASVLQTTNLAAFETKRSETFELEITTREGDIVKLSYSTEQSAGFQSSRIADQSGVQQELSAYSSQSKNLSFSVQGDLNDDEKKAIANMMKDVEKLANDFYGGDMQGAMQHALALNMNKEQLSRLSLDLAYTETRTAISAYQQVGALDQNKRSFEPLKNTEIGTIGNFNKSLEGLLQEADRFFRESDKLVKQLFRDIAPETGPAKNTLRDVLEGLITTASSRNEQEKAATVIS
jgi:hypothetical protein